MYTPGACIEVLGKVGGTELLPQLLEIGALVRCGRDPLSVGFLRVACHRRGEEDARGHHLLGEFLEDVTARKLLLDRGHRLGKLLGAAHGTECPGKNL